MTVYKQTRDTASIVTQKFSNMLKDLQDYYEEEIVVVSLRRYYEICAKPDKIDNTVNEYTDPDEDLLWAIERVLQDYMPSKDFSDWVLTRDHTKTEKMK